jgi:hypothetical protein
MRNGEGRFHIQSCTPMLLFQPFGSGGSDAKLYPVLSSCDILVHGEVRGGEYHEDRIGELAMEVQVFTLLRNLLGVPASAAAVRKWGRERK